MTRLNARRRPGQASGHNHLPADERQVGERAGQVGRRHSHCGVRMPQVGFDHQDVRNAGPVNGTGDLEKSRFVGNGQQDEAVGTSMPTLRLVREHLSELEGGVGGLCCLQARREVRSGQDVELALRCDGVALVNLMVHHEVNLRRDTGIVKRLIRQPEVVRRVDRRLAVQSPPRKLTQVSQHGRRHLDSGRSGTTDILGESDTRSQQQRVIEAPTIGFQLDPFEPGGQVFFGLLTHGTHANSLFIPALRSHGRIPGRRRWPERIERARARCSHHPAAGGPARGCRNPRGPAPTYRHGHIRGRPRTHRLLAGIRPDDGSSSTPVRRDDDRSRGVQPSLPIPPSKTCLTAVASSNVPMYRRASVGIARPL